MVAARRRRDCQPPDADAVAPPMAAGTALDAEGC
jgi:hypothetical protein